MSRHPLSEGPPRCWPSAGLRGGQLAVSSHVLWIVGGRLPLREYRGPGPVRASVVSVPGSRSEQGSHLPYTCRGLLRKQRRITIRSVPGWHVTVVPGAAEVAVRALLACDVSLGGDVQRRPRKYSKVTGALVAGRAVT